MNFQMDKKNCNYKQKSNAVWITNFLILLSQSKHSWSPFRETKTSSALKVQFHKPIVDWWPWRVPLFLRDSWPEKCLSLIWKLVCLRVNTEHSSQPATALLLTEHAHTRSRNENQSRCDRSKDEALIDIQRSFFLVFFCCWGKTQIFVQGEAPTPIIDKVLVAMNTASYVRLILYSQRDQHMIEWKDVSRHIYKST